LQSKARRQVIGYDSSSSVGEKRAKYEDWFEDFGGDRLCIDSESWHPFGVWIVECGEAQNVNNHHHNREVNDNLGEFHDDDGHDLDDGTASYFAPCHTSSCYLASRYIRPSATGE